MLAEQDFRYIQDLVRERAAIVLDPGKEYLAVTRLIRSCAVPGWVRSPSWRRPSARSGRPRSMKRSSMR